ncbi:MAG: hypothetical protein QXF55_03215 [Candidatus Aenigmatarchaeota archaeon]
MRQGCGQCAWPKDSSPLFDPINRPQKGLAALHVLVLTLLLVGIIVMFMAMVQNANYRELKVVRANADVMHTAGFAALLKASLEASWRTTATQLLFSGLGERFGLPTYFYSYDADSEPPSQLPAGCSDDKRLCVLTPDYAKAWLDSEIAKVRMPESFEVLVRLGRGLREFNRAVTLRTTARNLSIATDRVHGAINQSVKIGGPTETSAEMMWTITPEISTGLRGLLLAAQQAVSAALQLRASGIRYHEPRGYMISALQSLFDEKFGRVRETAGEGAWKARYRLLPEWSSDGTELQLGYDASVRLADDKPDIVFGLANKSACDAAIQAEYGPQPNLRTDLYNRHAGAIERAMPDELLEWVDEPRALLAALAEQQGWNPEAAGGLFGAAEGSLTPAKNAKQAVEQLKAAFEQAASEKAADALARALEIYLSHWEWLPPQSRSAQAVINRYVLWSRCLAVSQANASAANPNRILSPEDYARWLSEKTGTKISVGDEFCSESEWPLRGYRYLAYDFYAEGANQWPVWPAYAGVAIAVEPTSAAWDGCGGTVWVRTGDFLISYGGILPGVTEGSIVDGKRPIGTTAYLPPSQGQLCSNPRLQVMIYAPEWTVPSPNAVEELNACGSRMSHTEKAGDVQLSPNAVIATNESGPLNRHMAALEWDGLFRLNRTGRYWRMRERGVWERAPLALEFKMRDAFAVLDCATKGEWRGRWLNERDLLCADGKLWSCVNDVPGANVAAAGEEVGGYRCVEKDFLKPADWASIPASYPTYHSIAYRNFAMGKRLAKWCKVGGEGDEKTDWLCCEGQGKVQVCPPRTTTAIGLWYEVEGEALVCRHPDATCSPAR